MGTIGKWWENNMKLCHMNDRKIGGKIIKTNYSFGVFEHRTYYAWK